MESFDRFQLAALVLICLKNEASVESRADTERNLRELISLAGVDVAEKARRERLRHHLEFGQNAPVGIGNV